jgi:hypothetical protein
LSARTRNEEVFEVRGGKNQHFSRAIDPTEVDAIPRFCHLGPVLKVVEFLFRFLREQVVRQPNRQLSVAVQFVHNAIIVWIALKPAAGINSAGNSKAIQFPEE